MAAIAAQVPSKTSKVKSDDRPVLQPGLKLDIEYIPTASLKGYEHNARRHPERQIEQIADSIRVFGFVSPIIIDDANVVACGHARLEAAKAVGMESVPVVKLDHLSGRQLRALRLADNRLAENAIWDEAMLKIEFEALLEFDPKLDLDFDVGITGFTGAEVDRSLEWREVDTSADDIVPDLISSRPSVTRLGDLIQLGNHFIYCGDARDESSYAKVLGKERAVMGISDPPYNVSISNHVSRSGKHEEFVMGVGELDEAQFIEFLATFLRSSTKYSRPGSIQYAFMDSRHAYEMHVAGRSAGLELTTIAVWDKGVGGQGSLLRSQHEFVFMFKEPSGPHINNVALGKYHRNRTNVWAYPGSRSMRKELGLHPTPKPVALVADAILDVSNRNDIVLDAFCGSGTTLIAAAKTGRRARAIELDPHFVDIAVRRWQEWSGEEAVHIETGLSFRDLETQRGSHASGNHRSAATPARARPRPVGSSR